MNDDTAEPYCRQKAAPPGSNFYYCTLYFPYALKRELYAWHAFTTELERIQWECSDPGIARMKLAWWYEEIQRLESGHPRHPVSRELVHLIPRCASIRSSLRTIIHHYESRLVNTNYETPEQLMEFFTQGPGLLWSVSGELCGYQNPATAGFLNEAGCLFEIFNLLQHQPSNLTPEHPAYVLHRHWHNVDSSRHVKRLEELKTDLQTLVKNLPREDRSSQLHVIIMSKLILATCNEIARDGYRLDSCRVGLTPIRKLLLSRWVKFRYG